MADEGIVAQGLTVTYRNGFTALRDASLTVPKGSVTALVGVNGAGKSTLFKALMGFVPASRGTVQVMGMAVPEALRRNLIAYVPQAEEVDWTFPVLVQDVVMMGRYGHMGFLRRARPQDRAAVDQALERVGMTEFRHRQIGELSGGQKKRVFLALNRAFEMGAGFDGDGLVDDVALDPGGGGQPHLEATDAADDAAIDHDLVRDDLAPQRGAFAHGQQAGADVALDRALDLDVALGADVAGDGQVRRQHRRRGARARRGRGRRHVEIGFMAARCFRLGRRLSPGSGFGHAGLRKHFGLP